MPKLESRTEFTIRAARVMGLVLLTALALAVVTFAADVLLVIFGGVLLGVFFRGSANLLNDRTGLSPKMALSIVFLLFFGGAILALWLIGDLACVLGAVLWFLTDNQLVLLSLSGAGLLILAAYRPSKLFTYR